MSRPHRNELSPGQVQAIRRMAPGLLRKQSKIALSEMIGVIFDVEWHVIRQCIDHLTYKDPAYTPPVAKTHCPACNKDRFLRAFDYDPGGKRADTCQDCYMKAHPPEREDRRLGYRNDNICPTCQKRQREKGQGYCIECRRARDRDYKRSMYVRRASVDDERHYCRVCGMGVNTKGKAFTSQHDADQCCAGIKPIYRHSALETRGRFMMFNDRI